MTISETWKDYAIGVIKEAMETGNIEWNFPAVTAALALIQDLEEYRHPSYHNTQFALAAFFLPGRPLSLRPYAWRMVVNGLGGYWQWQTHNGGAFSVVEALVHVGILTGDEAANVQQFNVFEVNTGCHYFAMHPKFLARIVRVFNLPTTHPSIGGKGSLSQEEIRERSYMNQACLAACGGCDNPLYRHYALENM